MMVVDGCKWLTIIGAVILLVLNPLTVSQLGQRFSNFFQVGTTFISQNVLQTTLLLGLSNSLGLP